MKKCVLFAFAFCLLGANEQSTHDTQPPKQQSQAERPTADAPEGHKPRTTEHKPNCNRPRDQDEAATCAALVQANAAQTANSVRRDALRWNRIGIFAILITLIASAWAAWVATVAAKAARDSVDDARAAASEQTERFEQQLRALAAQRSADAYRLSGRAWMTLDSSRNGRFSGSGQNGEPVQNGVMWYFVLANSGGTPAIDLLCWTNIRIQLIQDNSIPHFEKPGEIPQKGVVAPRTTVTTPPRPLNDLETSQLEGNTHKAIARTRVEYRDVLHLDTVRVTECCCEIRANGRAVHPDGHVDVNYLIMPLGAEFRYITQRDIGKRCFPPTLHDVVIEADGGWYGSPQPCERTGHPHWSWSGACPPP